MFWFCSILNLHNEDKGQVKKMEITMETARTQLNYFKSKPNLGLKLESVNLFPRPED